MDGTESLRNRVILITGASGFTGGHACRYFAGLGMKVEAVVRDSSKLPAFETETVCYHTCDLFNQQRLSAIVREITPDYVLHLGGKNSVAESWEQPLMYMESNLFSMLYLLDALRPFPLCRILIAGSRISSELSSTYRSNHPYGLSKGLQKAAALSWEGLFDQFIMMAEPSNLIGPGPSAGFCSLLGRQIAQRAQGKKTELFRISSRENRRDFLDVRDAVRAYGLLLAQGMKGRNYPVCSGVERSLEEVANTMLSIADSDLPILWGDSLASGSASQVQHAVDLKCLGWGPEIAFSTSLTDIIQYFYREKGEIQ